MAVSGWPLQVACVLFLPSILALASSSIALVNLSSEWTEDSLLSFAINDVIHQHGMSLVILEDLPNISLERELDFTGVLSFEKCSVTHSSSRGILPNSSSRLPVLRLANGECETPPQSDTNVVPLFMADGHRKYSCLSYILGVWLRENILPSSPLKVPRFQDSKNYMALFLECVGSSYYTPAVRRKLTSEKGKAYLNGRKLLITTINRPPFLIFTFGGKDKKEIVTWRGYCIDMLNFLAEKFNFSYKLILPPDGNWGAPTPNGTFNGMVGMVQRHEVDFAMASLTITYIREQVIDFPHRFYEDPTTILIPPPVEIKNLFAFLSPFRPMIWLYILVAIFCTALMMWLVASYPKGMRAFMYPYKGKRYLHTRNIQFFRYLFETTFVLVAQGTRLKQTDSSRIILGFWWVFALIFSLSYTSTLIAFLTVPRMENLIDSLEELSNQRDILWTYRANTAYESLFGKAEPPSTYYKIGQLLHERPELKVSSDEEGVNVVLTKKMAYIKEKSWLDFAMERDFLKTGKCRLSQVPQPFFSAGFGWALQEGSSYLELFNDIFLRMRQNGLFEYWKKRYWPKPNKCSGARGSVTIRPRALSMEDFTGHFFILGLGAAFGFLIFIVEVVIRKLFKL